MRCPNHLTLTVFSNLTVIRKKVSSNLTVIHKKVDESVAVDLDETTKRDEKSGSTTIS